MPLYRVRKSFMAGEKIKGFLNLDIGVTRGKLPPDDAQLQGRVKELERELKNTREELSETREQLSKEQERTDQSATPEETPEKRSHDKEPDGVIYDGVLLPPPRVRPNKKGKRGEKIYFEATRREVEWMAENLGLSTKSSVLDLGCGSGRVALGILDRIGELREYRGVDVNKPFLSWAQRHITPEHPNFQFIHLDAENAAYNPDGEQIGPDFVLPFSDNQFDIICLFSVFTHMLTDDVRAYLEELHRLIQPEGKVFMTANLEEGVPDVTENPIGYRGRRKYKRPLASVRYNREFFENLLDERGFHLEGYSPELRKVQRCLTVSKKAL